jgi:Lrp/AsnC family transcriptional regulator, regulator for asnA, asnC and gidA
MYDIDKIDWQIVEILMQDGRISSSEIARRVGNISERVVRYRIKKLSSEGVIRISAIINPRKLGYDVVADVFIEVEPSHIREVAKELIELDRVSYLAFSIGEDDISLQVVAHSNDEVYQFVADSIGKLVGVRKTTTSIVPNVLKDIYEWHIPQEVVNC